MTDLIKPPPTLDQLRARRDKTLAVAAKHGAYKVRVVGWRAAKRHGKALSICC